MALPKWIDELINGKPQLETHESIDKEFYFKLLDLNCDAIAFYSDKAGCIGANKHFLSLFNFSDLDDYAHEHENFHSLFNDEDEVIIAENDTVWFTYIHQMYPKGYGVRFVDKDEKIRHIQLFVETIHHNEQELYYITLKEAQELQEIQSHVVESEAIKRTFLSDVGMQFRTPMQGILGFVKMLEHTMLDTTQKVYLSQVSIAAQELIVNLETLLDTAEMEVTPLVETQADFHPFIEIDTLLNSFIQKAKEHQVKIYSDIDPRLPKTIQGDSKKIKQLLVYLLNYALQIAYKEADITFAMHQGDENIYDTTELNCSLSISNTIADPRRDDLSVIRKLITLLGGELEITCNDEGSASLTFSIFFQPLKEPEVLIAKELDPYRVLVVEDNRINQNLMRLMLQEYGLDVVVADNGQDAIEKADSSNFDLVFMDIDMPIKNGIEATKEIKENRRDATVFMPIIAVTALAMQGDRERLLNAGLDDYIAKPITREMLVYILNKYLDIGV
ncbi:MAG: response regulator [Campylobacterota bacterium]|nr:response regulator [Campylobacterota bacterium]